MRETLLPLIGEWRDVLIRADGVRIDSGWRRNQIQNTYAQLLAAFVGLESTFLPVGFQYMAVGSGLLAWDTTPPIQSYGDTTLTTEFYRKAITKFDTSYRDPATFAVSVPITNVIQVDITFGIGEATGDHREWGIFAGNATGVVDTGYMFNWVVVPKLTKGAGDVLTRSVRFTFPIQ